MPQSTLATPVGRSRRRGEALERALYEATLAELSDVGYGGLTMEGIAARAHTGKAALYRRWGSKQELVHDPSAITPFTAKIGPALINQQFLLAGLPPNRRELALIVDTVIPPKAATP